MAAGERQAAAWEELDDAIELLEHYAGMWRSGRRGKWLPYLGVAATRLHKCAERLMRQEGLPAPGKYDVKRKDYDYGCDNEE